MQIFEYGQKEIDFLKRKDKRLGVAIDLQRNDGVTGSIT